MPVWLQADRTRIAQLLGNLLQNAAKLTPPGGRTVVRIGTDDVEQRALLSVEDTGAGLAPETLAHVFDAFSQADRTLDRSQGGLGLGLALVKGLVALHGGEVSAHSEGLGRGAELTVRLPLDVEAAESASNAHTEPGIGARRRVLLIEDNEDAANSMRDALELLHHDVAIASTGPEGVEKARELLPDVVLCDLGLPGIDGYEVARTLRADPRLWRASLVALTGYAAPEDTAKSRAAGFDMHLAKPLSWTPTTSMSVPLPVVIESSSRRCSPALDSCSARRDPVSGSRASAVMLSLTPISPTGVRVPSSATVTSRGDSSRVVP